MQSAIQTPGGVRARQINSLDSDLGEHLSTCYFHWFKHLHKHGAQFEEVIMFWVLHFYHSPGVQTPSDLLSFHLNQLVGANYSKGNAGLKKKCKVNESQEKEVWKKGWESMFDECWCISGSLTFRTLVCSLNSSSSSESASGSW